MKHIFILNTFSLKEKCSLIEKKIEEICKNEKINYSIEKNSETLSTEDIIQNYKNEEVILIPVGGDGTINRVLNAMNIEKNILGYIPYGTGNDFYKANQELLKDGINTIDLVKINDSYFINVACFGIDADIGNHTDIIHSNLIPKKQRYNLGLIYHFISYKPRKLKIEVEKETIERDFTTVAVCNARYYGGGYKIAPKSSLQDGLLDVYLVESTNKWTMLRLITGMKHALHEKSNKTRKILCKEIVISTKNEMECNVDGEILKDKTFKIKIIPKGINIYYNQTLINKIIGGIK